MPWRNGIREIFQEMKGPNLVYPELKSLEPAIGGFQILRYIYNCLMAAKSTRPKQKMFQQTWIKMHRIFIHQYDHLRHCIAALLTMMQLEGLD